MTYQDPGLGRLFIALLNATTDLLRDLLAEVAYWILMVVGTVFGVSMMLLFLGYQGSRPILLFIIDYPEYTLYPALLGTVYVLVVAVMNDREWRQVQDSLEKGLPDFLRSIVELDGKSVHISKSRMESLSEALKAYQKYFVHSSWHNLHTFVLTEEGKRYLENAPSID